MSSADPLDNLTPSVTSNKFYTGVEAEVVAPVETDNTKLLASLKLNAGIEKYLLSKPEILNAKFNEGDFKKKDVDTKKAHLEFLFSQFKS